MTIYTGRIRLGKFRHIRSTGQVPSHKFLTILYSTGTGMTATSYAVVVIADFRSVGDIALNTSLRKSKGE